MSSAPSSQTIPIEAADLPLHCPTSKTPLWNQHPRVFLEFDASGKAKCPYCGTDYQVDPDQLHHH